MPTQLAPDCYVLMVEYPKTLKPVQWIARNTDGGFFVGLTSDMGDANTIEFSDMKSAEKFRKSIGPLVRASYPDARIKIASRFKPRAES